jgi:hypothetical protein
MTELEDLSRDRLKHHFAQRVIHQARQILETWQRLQKAEWSADNMAELKRVDAAADALCGAVRTGRTSGAGAGT